MEVQYPLRSLLSVQQGGCNSAVAFFVEEETTYAEENSFTVTFLQPQRATG